VCDGCLYEAVCRERADLRVIFGYIELCIDRELNCVDIWLH
jgi:hypothetical protein